MDRSRITSCQSSHALSGREQNAATATSLHQPQGHSRILNCYWALCSSTAAASRSTGGASSFGRLREGQTTAPASDQASEARPLPMPPAPRSSSSASNQPRHLPAGPMHSQMHFSPAEVLPCATAGTLGPLDVRAMLARGAAKLSHC